MEQVAFRGHVEAGAVCCGEGRKQAARGWPRRGALRLTQACDTGCVVELVRTEWVEMREIVREGGAGVVRVSSRDWPDGTGLGASSGRD